MISYDYFVFVASVFSAIGWGLCQRSSPDMICFVSTGPQVLGSYSWTGVTFPKNRIDNTPSGFYAVLTNK